MRSRAQWDARTPSEPMIPPRRTPPTWVLVAILLAGCKKHPPPLATLPPAPVPVVREPGEILVDPPSPNAVAARKPSGPLLDIQPMRLPPPAPPPKKVKKRPTSKPPIITAPVTPVTPAPAPPASGETEREKPVEPPRLGLLLTPDEQMKLNQTIDSDLRTANGLLAEAMAKNLNDSQKSVVRQIRSFIGQAEELRKNDLAAAKGISHKAVVLAQDLAASAR